MRSKQYNTPYYKRLFARMERDKEHLKRIRERGDSNLVNGFFGDQKYWDKVWEEEKQKPPLQTLK